MVTDDHISLLTRLTDIGLAARVTDLLDLLVDCQEALVGSGGERKRRRREEHGRVVLAATGGRQGPGSTVLTLAHHCEYAVTPGF